jgi:hypothetical protein
VGSATSRLWLAAGVAGLLLAAAPRASAQSEGDKKQAQALQSEGLRLMQKGDNQGAVAKFEEAFRLVASPKILFNMGKAHLALGDQAKALEELQRFLDEAPFAPKESRDEARKHVEALQPHLAYIDVQTDDVGSTISVDGRVLGSAPLPRPIVVTPGTHELRVEKTDMVTDVRQVSPIAGQKVRVAVKLTSVAARVPAPVAVMPPPVAGAAPTPGAAPVTAAPAPAPGAPAPAAGLVATPEPGGDGGARLRIMGIALGAAGVVSVAVGIGFGLAAKSNGEDNARTGATFSASAYDAGHRDQTLQYVGYAMGAALVAGGVTCYLLGNRGHEPAPGTPMVAFVPASGGGLAVGALRF